VQNSNSSIIATLWTSP